MHCGGHAFNVGLSIYTGKYYKVTCFVNEVKSVAFSVARRST